MYYIFFLVVIRNLQRKISKNYDPEGPSEEGGGVWKEDIISEPGGHLEGTIFRPCH